MTSIFLDGFNILKKETLSSKDGVFSSHLERGYVRDCSY